ncbi:sigma-70 family RNA polymerase sigma factor [Streptomyces sp. NPDC101776]|uniref:sigma-70 family RNA polymerase sigma factor n=1 Tax=Streptomyces sp. NPDC101776 TaxID=3366146 RepID=UPI00380D6D90
MPGKRRNCTPRPDCGRPSCAVCLPATSESARDCLVVHNQRLAHSILRGYLEQGLEYDDLFQHAVLGLMKAARKFDPARGYKFSTYATWWVRQTIVVIPDTHRDAAVDPTSAALRMTYYVLATRARHELHLAYEGDTEPPLCAQVGSGYLLRG